MSQARIALTVLFALLLLWSLWAWRRAPPASPDAFYARNNALLSVAFLLTLAPALIWGGDSGVVLVAGLLAVVPFAMAIVAYVRRRTDGKSEPTA